MGKTKGAVSQWELNISAPRKDTLALLANHLGVTVSWLMGRADVDLATATRKRTQLSGMALVSRMSTALAENRLTSAQVQILGDLIDQFLPLEVPPVAALAAAGRANTADSV